MRRTLFGALAALFVAVSPLGGALAIEAKQLREDIIAGLALYGGPGAGLPLTYDEVRVWPKDGGHRVEIAGLMGENVELGVRADLGDVAFSVQETKPGHYRVFDLSIPASVPVIDGEGLHVAPGLRGLDTGCVHHGRNGDRALTAWLPDERRSTPFGVPDESFWRVPAKRIYYAARELL